MWAIRLNAASGCTGRTGTSLLRGTSRFGNALVNRRIGCRLLSAEAEDRSQNITTRDSSKATPVTLPRLGQRTVLIDRVRYEADSWFNVPSNVIEKVPRRLHLQKDHPVSITRQIIESVFPPPTFRYYNDLDPVVSTRQNFDSLGFPDDHPGRSRSDTYYINADTLLRTHTSAHQADTFRANLSEGYLVSADVYRRDEVDRSHYPVFHQMEGARSWDRAKAPAGDVAAQVWSDVEKLPRPAGVAVQDPNPPFHAERNPLQAAHHSPAEVEAIAAHLKRSLELVVVEIFSRARAATAKARAMVTPVVGGSGGGGDGDGGDGGDGGPLQVRWVEAYFPFTSPSWELEVFWGGAWLEVLGCGVVRQQLYVDAGVPGQLGWAFGVGLDRLAMLLFQIPDIRLFWSLDERFLRQFRGMSDDLDSLRRFHPFSKHPGCWKDVSFWLASSSSSSSSSAAASAAAPDFHGNDVMEIIRSIGGDVVEDVRLVDSFTHPGSGRRSMCYRITYRSVERTLTNRETNQLHDQVSQALARELGVEIR